MEYPKIKTLFERDLKTFVVNPEKIKNPVFSIIKSWQVTEKIDGMNIRIMLDKEGKVIIGGRTDKAQISCDLLNYLNNIFTPEKMQSLWQYDKEGKIEPISIILY